MLTLFHAPNTRSTGVLALLHAMGKRDAVDVRVVGLRRSDGTGAADSANPHPEGKVPTLMVGKEMLRERNAIVLFLTDHFRSDLGRDVGAAGRASYLRWLAYYGNVVEPVLISEAAGVADHPAMQSTFRGRPEMEAELSAALTDQPFLLGDDYSAADLLMASPFVWFPEFMPAAQSIRDWVARCGAHPSAALAAQEEARMTADA
ncbi:glutathione S-transferase family protein [Puniceibacterium sp. IMCC21224]|uniref:glutathione S-transferase family protein n=1 Tax=Puniceibacterium sp. IMCC21224 TaxID=1618204 RepID=UPI00064D97DF|nr:glutathione S-transferase [Puniceibacterium sp. IMCC21224]KMK67200.1 glutathione S-transferase [Puniceibacterium sp. IMCC21224]